jgi:hypothetical protein
MSIIDTIIRAAQEVETAKRLHEINWTIREIKWLSVMLLVYGLDGGLTSTEVIASVFIMYIVMFTTSLIWFLWEQFRIGFARAWKKRESQSASKVKPNA